MVGFRSGNKLVAQVYPSAAALPGGSTVSIPPQGVVLDLWGSGAQLALAGDRIETDGGTAASSVDATSRSHPSEVAQIGQRRKRRPQTVVQLPAGLPGQAVVVMVISALPSMADSW